MNTQYQLLVIGHQWYQLTTFLKSKISTNILLKNTADWFLPDLAVDLLLPGESC